MHNTIRKLCIDTSLLPTEPIYSKLYPIVSKRIQDRCHTVCVNRGSADYTVRFCVDATVPAEGFRINDLQDTIGVEITGADFLALMYGAGQFLHTSRYIRQTILPTSWRGQSVPACEKRMIFFAQHFYNWYQCCSAEEICEHIEDLTLWGINGVVSVFSCLNLTSWDDPNLADLVALFHKTLSAARALNLKIGIEYSNVDFMVPNTAVAADKKYMISQTGHLVCPSTEEGFAYYQSMLARILDYTDAFGGLDFITIWSYDEGGCSCDRCWPWGGRGFYNMAHRISKYIKGRYPKIEIWLATWYLGRHERQKEEWPLLYKNLQADAAKGDNWADYLLLETRDDYDAVFFPIRNGQPTAHTKLLTFPDVSMCGVTPWGGFGAIVTPKLMERQEAPFAPHCSGGYLYTEGIFDDMNKIITLGLYWDRNRPTSQTIADYCGYEFKGIDAKELIQLIDHIEASHLLTNRFDRKPCNLQDCDAAWALAEKINAAAEDDTKAYWKWRILYIRAYLDKVRYHKCAEANWPLERLTKGSMHFWRQFLAHDEKAQEMLLELIGLYKAQEVDDHSKYAYHFYVRPPRTEGANLEAEKNANVTMI